MSANTKTTNRSEVLTSLKLSPLDLIVLEYGLLAQARLLPYALGVFALGLPLYLYSGLSVGEPIVMGLSLGLFSLNWALFYALNHSIQKIRQTLSALEDKPAEKARSIEKIFWRQAAGALLWVISLNCICLFAAASGAKSHLFLMVCAGASVAIVFFCAPVLLMLLSLGVLAAIGPIIALYSSQSAPEIAQLLTGALALGMAMGFILNRHLIEHYRLMSEQKTLAQERETFIQVQQAMHDTRMALMHTLSREVFTNLCDLKVCLDQAHGHLARAPAPRLPIEQAQSLAEQLKAMITTTLDNEIAEAGKVRLDLISIDMKSMLEGLINKHRPIIQSSGLEIGLTIIDWPSSTTQAGSVIADAQRLEQILDHLVNNARLYARQGMINVTLNRISHEMARIEVIDQGPGLTHEEVERAFMAHQRIKRTCQGQIGSGLGLSLSRALAHLMGARLSAQSTTGIGTKFVLDLPFDPEAVLPTSEVSTDEPQKINPNDSSLKILLVANDSLRAAQLRNALEKLGHRCMTATSKQRAIALATKVEIDACILSGISLARDPQTADVNTDPLTDLIALQEQLKSAQGQRKLNLIVLCEADDSHNLVDYGITRLSFPLSETALRRALEDTPNHHDFIDQAVA